MVYARDYEHLFEPRRLLQEWCKPLPVSAYYRQDEEDETRTETKKCSAAFASQWGTWFSE